MTTAAGGALFIGIDGGGTKTLCFVIDGTKKLLGRGVAGGSNPNSLGDSVASTNFRSAILGALQSMEDSMHTIADQEPAVVALDMMTEGLTLEQRRISLLPQLRRVRAIAAGLSGCDRPCDVEKMTLWIRNMLPDENNAIDTSIATTPATTSEGKEAKAAFVSTAKGTAYTRVSVFNDAVSALASGTLGHLFGVVLICGTGMISFGRNKDGSEARAGGRGALIDGGSGYNIGLNVLKAVLEGFDGVTEPTSMTDMVLKRTGLTQVEDLIGWIYGDLSWARVADLARYAFRAESEGDVVARRLLVQAANDLAAAVTTVSRKLDFAKHPSPVPIVCAGSIMAQPAMFRLVSDLVLPKFPNAELTLPKVDPAMGAALLAFNS